MQNGTKAQQAEELTSENPVLLSADQVAGMMKISRTWLFKLIHTKKFPHPPYVKLGPHCYRFPKKEVIEWLQSRTIYAKENRRV